MVLQGSLCSSVQSLNPFLEMDKPKSTLGIFQAKQNVQFLSMLEPYTSECGVDLLMISKEEELVVSNCGASGNIHNSQLIISAVMEL